MNAFDRIGDLVDANSEPIPFPPIRAYFSVGITRAAEQALNGERQRISISIPRRDLLRLQARAAEEGMPYQTLINSILHKYVES